MSGVRLTWKDDVVAALLAAGAMTALLSTVGNLGYARDEGFYFHAADTYARWFDILLKNPSAALDQKTIDTYWRFNSEHPGLIKSLFALSNLYLQKKWQLFSMAGTSYRFPAIALAGAAIALVYRFGAAARGRLVGLFAALALLLMPRFFYQAHLACFDVPIITMFLLTVFSYWKSLKQGGWAWPIVTGLSFGLALDTKHNSWFLPILFVAHTTAIAIRGKFLQYDVKPIIGRSIKTLGFMALLGPLVMYAFWPWIWHDTASRLKWYANFHLFHEYYNMEFLGQTYWRPPMPRLYAPVMTAATVPMITLALVLTGFIFCLRAEVLRWKRRGKVAKDEVGSDILWLFGAGICYGAWVFPTTPIFGGTKHWMTAYPFLALFAGTGFSYVVTLLRKQLRHAKPVSIRDLSSGPVAAFGMLSLTLAAPLAETVNSHPWGLSAYTPLVGGAKGAATLGLNRTFWGYTTGAVVDYLNREVPPHGTVYVHDTSWPAWEMLLQDGRLRRDIRGVGWVHEAQFALYHHETHMHGQEYQAWVTYGTVRPDHIAGLNGVPVIWIYRKK